MNTSYKNFQNLRRIFKNKRIFLTGHTGFKGSWLSLFFKLLGSKVYGYSLPPKKKSFFLKANLKKIFYKSIYHDIRDFFYLKKIIKNFKPHVVIHLAAQAYVRQSYINPYDTFQINTVGTMNILEVIKEQNFTKNVLIITSDKVYKNINKKTQFKESDRLGANDPYGSSKACAELVFSAYNNSFFKNKKTNVLTVRAGNVIGGGDYSKDRIIPDYFRALEGNKVLKLRYPLSIRPWQHVFDPLYGYLLIISFFFKKKKINFDSFNFGPSKKNFINVGQLINKINLNFNNKVKIIIKKNIKEKKKEDKFLMLSSKRAHKIFGWKATCSIDKSVKLISDWYTNSKNNCLDFSEKQILEYFKNL